MTPSVRDDPFACEIHDNRYPVYKRLRDEAPAYFDEQHGFWALSRCDDVRAHSGNVVGYTKVPVRFR